MKHQIRKASVPKYPNLTRVSGMLEFAGVSVPFCVWFSSSSPTKIFGIPGELETLPVRVKAGDVSLLLINMLDVLTVQDEDGNCEEVNTFPDF